MHPKFHGLKPFLIIYQYPQSRVLHFPLFPPFLLFLLGGALQHPIISRITVPPRDAGTLPAHRLMPLELSKCPEGSDRPSRCKRKLKGVFCSFRLPSLLVSSAETVALRIIHSSIHSSQKQNSLSSSLHSSIHSTMSGYIVVFNAGQCFLPTPLVSPFPPSSLLHSSIHPSIHQ